MLTELRIYITHPGMAGPFAKLYEEEGLPIQLPVGAALKGFYKTEVGDPNQVVLIWEYESYEDRTAKRDELFKVPAWMAFLKKAAPMVQSEKNHLMTSVMD